MPRESAHVTQAERNESLYATLCSPLSSETEYTEWEVVALFYSALHYVDAYLDRTISYHPKGHTDRNTWVGRIGDLGPIASYYLHLYTQSRKARYDLIPFPVGAVRGFESGQFAPVKNRMRTLLNI